MDEIVKKVAEAAPASAAPTGQPGSLDREIRLRVRAQTMGRQRKQAEVWSEVSGPSVSRARKCRRLSVRISGLFIRASFTPTVQPFSSRFSSFRNRQSVPWAMIFCGLDLMSPASWRRSA